MKKIITIILSTFAITSFAGQPEIKTQIVNSKQIGHADGHDAKGFVGTNIYSAKLEVKKDDTTILIPVLHTINDRKIESIFIEREKAPDLNKDLKEADISKSELVLLLKKKYKEVLLD